MFGVFFPLIFGYLYKTDENHHLILKSYIPLKSANNSSALRVIDGKYANLGDFPYQISFKDRLSNNPRLYYNFCGGALISSNKIVSTAHCFDAPPQTMCQKFLNTRSVGSYDQYWAHAGSLLTLAAPATTDSAQTGQWRRISHCQFNEDYNYPDHDIAVLTVSYPFSLNDIVRPIPIATVFKEYSRTKCVASGYGLENHGKVSKLAVLLQYTVLNVLTMKECRNGRIHTKGSNQFICTSPFYNADLAEGDSGGPLVCFQSGDPNDQGRGVLAGLALGHSDRQGTIFTRVSSHKDFLQRAGVLRTNSCDCVFNNVAINIVVIFIVMFF